MISSLSRMILLTLISLVLLRMLTYVLRELLMLAAELLIAVPVIAHSSRTESVPFYWKS
jgi:hypothetical protein